MIDLKIKGLTESRSFLKGFEDQLPYATALAMTRAAKAAQAAMPSAMEKALDNPTPYTKRSAYIRPATKKKLKAEIGIKDFAPKGTPAVKYLQPLITGGKRNMKRSERALTMRGKLRSGQYLVPGKDARLNKYGNIPGPQVVRALSNVRGHSDRYQDTSPASAARSKRRGAKQYFWMPGKGIFYRQGKQVKSFMVIASEPKYQKRFDFYGVAQTKFGEAYPGELNLAIKQAMQTAKKK